MYSNIHRNMRHVLSSALLGNRVSSTNIARLCLSSSVLLGFDVQSMSTFIHIHIQKHKQKILLTENQNIQSHSYAYKHQHRAIGVGRLLDSVCM